MPVVDERSRPVLKRNVIDVDGRVQRGAWLVASRVDSQPSAATPKSLFAWRRIQADPAIRPTWRRPCRAGRRRVLREQDHCKDNNPLIHTAVTFISPSKAWDSSRWRWGAF